MNSNNFIYKENVQKPVAGSNINYIWQITIIRTFFIIIILAIPIGIYYAFNYYLIEQKNNYLFGIITLIFVFFCFNFIFFWLTKKWLYGLIPIKITSKSIIMPTTFFEKKILKQECISIKNIKKIYTKPSGFSGEETSEDYIRNDLVPYHNQIILETIDGKKFISGPKGINQITEMKHIINKYWPKLWIEYIN